MRLLALDSQPTLPLVSGSRSRLRLRLLPAPRALCRQLVCLPRDARWQDRQGLCLASVTSPSKQDPRVSVGVTGARQVGAVAVGLRGQGCRGIQKERAVAVVTSGQLGQIEKLASVGELEEWASVGKSVHLEEILSWKCCQLVTSPCGKDGSVGAVAG